MSENHRSRFARPHQSLLLILCVSLLSQSALAGATANNWGCVPMPGPNDVRTGDFLKRDQDYARNMGRLLDRYAGRPVIVFDNTGHGVPNAAEANSRGMPASMDTSHLTRSTNKHRVRDQIGSFGEPLLDPPLPFPGEPINTGVFVGVDVHEGGEFSAPPVNPCLIAPGTVIIITTEGRFDRGSYSVSPGFFGEEFGEWVEMAVACGAELVIHGLDPRTSDDLPELRRPRMLEGRWR